MNVVVAGAGWVTAGGLGRARGGEAFVPGPGELRAPSRLSVFPDPYQRFGRLDDFSKVGLAGVTLALRDAGMEAWTAKRPVGIVAATLFGCLATDADYLETFLPGSGTPASPNLFAYTLPNAFLGESAIRHGLAGPTVALLGDSGAGAVAWAVDLLAEGCEAMVAGLCDVAPPPPVVTPAGFAPGALFVVLRRGQAGDGRLGALETDGLGGIALDGRAIGDLPSLVTGILAERMQP